MEEPERLKSNSNRLTSWLSAGAQEKPIEVGEDDAPPNIRREDDDEGFIALDDIPEVGRAGIAATSSKRKRKRRDDDDRNSEDTFEKLPDAVQDSRRAHQLANHEEVQQDDKKKLALNTSYEGFSIYGRILCLIVKRRGGKGKAAASVAGTSSAMLENWVSTQAQQERQVDEND